jgi:factor associated with neutral sphingomyelinase activation
LASSGGALTKSVSLGELSEQRQDWQFDARQLKCVATQKLHTDAVTALHLSASRELLYTASQDTSAKVFKVGERATARTIGNATQMAVSGVATLDYAKHGTIESELDTPVILSSWDNHVYVYAPAYGRVLDSLNAHEDAVSCLALRHSVLATGSWDANVRIWAVRDTNIEPQPVGTLEFDDEVRCVAMDESGFLIAAGAADGAVMLFDSRVGKEVQAYESHGDSIGAVGLLRDGVRLVSCAHDGSFRVTDMRGGATVFERSTGRGQLRSVLCGPDALVVGGGDGSIAFYSLTTGDTLHVLAGAHGANAVGALVATSDGLISGADDGVVKIWSCK